MPFARSEIVTAVVMKTQASRYNAMQSDAYLSAFQSSLLHTYSGPHKCVTEIRTLQFVGLLTALLNVLLSYGNFPLHIEPHIRFIRLYVNYCRENLDSR